MLHVLCAVSAPNVLLHFAPSETFDLNASQNHGAFYGLCNAGSFLLQLTSCELQIDAGLANSVPKFCTRVPFHMTGLV